ncbi:hypothetical protein NEMBOFW57_002716 [Staphylotrichum longicolle]|uniref:Zn(2)-C6 fungal-type domain-containing protein n=1 Tax=Staphylotrichum longicolle TaxID=669026 RepID=A0AAD4F402_9PEZI|nr:hypothetical protein NEMBOFW57_002716 [Staphylotrichum longicolle]
MDSAALDPALRSTAIGTTAASAPSLPPAAHDVVTQSKSQQQQQQQRPLMSPWQNQAQHQQQQQQQQQQQHARPGPTSHAIPQPHDATGAFSPQTPNSTTTAATPSTVVTLDHHHPLHTNTNSNNNPSATTPYNPSPDTSHSHHDDLHDHAGGQPGDPKKPRACESCRGLKVRCDPDPADPEGPCKRCVKAKRPCVVTQPTRKRQKKTDSRVAELEKKIDALTASLQATRRVQQQHQQQQRQEEAAVRYPPPPPQVVAPAPVSAPAPLLPPPQPVSSSVGLQLPLPAGMAAAGQKRKFEERRDSGEDAGSGLGSRDAASGSSSVTPQPAGEAGKEQVQADVVDRGILTMALAHELLMRYVNQMCPHLPGVILPPGLTVAELRASKPILFLSVMAAASSEMPNLQRVLTKEMMLMFADRIISLELVQALQVSVIWYWPPERFEELKFYQMVHIAAVMAIEIGLGRKKAARGGFRKHISHAWRDHPLRKQAPPDPTTLEARRAWLTCYFMATNTSMALHRPNLIRWTPFVAECMDVLESSPDAVPTDKYLCHLVWTHKLAEEVGIQFSMDDPASTPNLAEPRTQHALKGFERELERYLYAIPKDFQQPSLKMSFHVINLYMHEVATHNDASDECRHPSEALLGSDSPLPPAHINALSACLTAIDGIFEVFLSLDVHTIRCLPVFNFVRVAYAVVVLIKLYFAASSPKSELGKVINKDQMKVEEHLGNLLEKFRATAADDRSRPAAKFLVVLVMIRSWFQKQKQTQNGATTNPGVSTDTTPTPYPRPSGAGERGSSATPIPQPPQQPDYPTTASTPLQLLSEIATNNSASVTGARGRPPTQTSSRPPARPPAPGSTDRPSSTTPPLPPRPLNNSNPPGQQRLAPYLPQQQQTPMEGGAGTMAVPWLSNTTTPLMPASGPGGGGGGDIDYDYNMFGDGFAQAMDLTLGGFVDGGLGGEDGAFRYMMQHDPGWFTGLGVGMDSLGGGGGYGF